MISNRIRNQEIRIKNGHLAVVEKVIRKERMISQEFIAAVEEILSQKFNLKSHVSNLKSVSGGCINHAHQIETNHGNFFLKYNDAKLYPGMFEAEAKGLQLLGSTNTLFIPEVVATGEAEGKLFLILQWIESGKREKNFWKNFGEKLAQLHKRSSGNFGLDHNNYIGSLPQRNSQHNSWNEFFINERIEPQLKLAIDQHAFAHQLVSQFANLAKKLPEIIPEEKPSLLHGDLWNGNYMVSPGGSACLIDPAVYYGHREMDLAMTKLFGGFDPEFYKSYNQAYPLEKGFESRVEIHNLYPLMVHVNLFGGGYVQQVQNILSAF